ncbi:type IV pilus twitching motility protein PilT [Paenibacillus sp. JX-17]|uniref:Type IV pilus twitching motility protein PilT n=1 Tax=Paenibacillus lacisoli TaxID=3064525 RepID=A0ABT9CDE0_9BACL|nr:type IV pilus twitching motility protein PilT [Paenibacillus sp. JX-17]MDO7906593.1 type IV pilus twitching motility protein PilT [Paenibacillus sp. JX-17]
MLQSTSVIEQLLRSTWEAGASDLHISAGVPPMLRVDGALRPLDSSILRPEDTDHMAEGLLGPVRTVKFREAGELDFSHSLPGACRFRVNVYRERGETGIAARVIPSDIPSLEQLGMPRVLTRLAQRPHGLILVTGPTGSGKSSTLAAVIDYINRNHNKHIVTLEDPIEFVHSHRSSLIHQREIGSDTASFADGLRAALRQDPDVILVGEMRDLETISAAVTAAETGHLVLATLHTTNAPQSVDRIIDAFPAHQQEQIRTQLAAVLVAVVSQRLFPRSHGSGRVCTAEVLVNNPAVANLIRSGKNHQILNVMQTGRALGMQTMEMAIREQLQQGTIDAAAARLYLPEAGS